MFFGFMCAGHMVQGMARSGGGAATRPWKNLRPRQIISKVGSAYKCNICNI